METRPYGTVFVNYFVGASIARPPPTILRDVINAVTYKIPSTSSTAKAVPLPLEGKAVNKKKPLK